MHILSIGLYFIGHLNLVIIFGNNEVLFYGTSVKGLFYLLWKVWFSHEIDSETLTRWFQTWEERKHCFLMQSAVPKLNFGTSLYILNIGKEMLHWVLLVFAEGFRYVSFVLSCINANFAETFINGIWISFWCLCCAISCLLLEYVYGFQMKLNDCFQQMPVETVSKQFSDKTEMESCSHLPRERRCG